MVFICDERSQKPGQKQAGMQERYQDALSKHCPLSMQRILLKICAAFCAIKGAKLFVTTKMASMTDEKFNNLLQDCTKAVHMPSTHRHFVAVTTDWIKPHISCKIGTIYACYVGLVDDVQNSAISKIRTL